MVRANAHVQGRLHSEIERLDDGRLPIAEICRRVGIAAEGRGLTRPSYEQIRTHVHAIRRLRRVSRAEILSDLTSRARPPAVLLEELVDPPLKRD
jgi:hypothetical protein